MAPLAGPDERTLHHLIGEIARRDPARPALREGEVRVAFGELWERAGRLASRLVATGVSPGEVVAVALPRSIELLVACIAILRAGGLALTLDLRVPDGRNRRIIEAAAPRWSIVRGSEVPGAVMDTVAIDVTGANPRAEAPHPEVRAADPAFLVFTSGSSGRPRGVVLSHGALVERSKAEHAFYGFTRDDVYFLRASPAFIALPVALTILASGVPVLIASDGRGDDAKELADAIRTARVTCAGFPPRIIESLLGLSAAGSSLASLRVLRSSGEALPPDLASRLRAILPSCRLVDGYGTTEAGGVITSADVGEEAGEGPGHAGIPLPGMTLRLVAGDGSPGTEGEVWVASPMLATGYLGGESGDEPKFVEEPESPEGEPRRWYRTGDRGRLTPDGRLVVLGRLDLQLNVDGVRVDPVEIEDAFRLHESVADAAVWTHPDAAGRSRLVAYLVDRPPRSPSGVLRSFLGRLLPPTLIPVRFVHVDALPLTPSGKVDRPALPRPEALERTGREPKSETESRLLALFREVLGVPGIGVTDDFFEWGGDSVTAFDLMTRVFEATGVRLSGATLLSAPTVAELAREVERGDRGGVSSVWLRKSGDLPPLVCLPGLAGDPLWMFPLIAALDPRQPLLGLSFVGLKPPIRIDRAASRGLDELRAVQARGPYFLLGHSLGGVLAFEMARELKAAGEKVAFLGLLDTLVPGSPRFRSPGPMPPPGRAGIRVLRDAKTRLRGLLSFLGVGGRGAASSPAPGFRQALQNHRILPCDLSVTLFRARERGDASDLLAEWALIARGGVEVLDIPGHHFSVLTGGRANELSSKIAEAVARARERV